MKFKLDGNLGELGRDVLAAAGHDISTTAEQGMSRVGDDDLYEASRAERRVLITLDRDFGEVLRFPTENTSGIVVLNCRGRMSPALILARIEECIALLQSASGRPTLDH